LANLERLNVQPAVAVLTVTTRLSDESAFALCLGRDGFSVSNLRLALVCLNAKLSVQSVNNDFKVKLTHSGNDRLTRLDVGLNSEGRILLCKSAKRRTQFLLVSLRFRLDCDLDNWFRELDCFKSDWLRRIANGVSGDDVAKTDNANDFSRKYFVQVLSVIGVHFQDSTDALAPGSNLVRGRISVNDRNRRTLLERT
jgi:hypothetical protein